MHRTLAVMPQNERGSSGVTEAQSEYDDQFKETISTRWHAIVKTFVFE
jgi:hypothetical protein